MLQGSESEQTVKDVIEDTATGIVREVAIRSTALISHEVRFAMGGLIPKLRDNGGLHSSVAIAGTGDQGVFSGISGELLVAAEYKLDPTVNWLGTQALRRLYYQGLAFMVISTF
jgi:hypothetical protein